MEITCLGPVLLTQAFHYHAHLKSYERERGLTPITQDSGDREREIRGGEMGCRQDRRAEDGENNGGTKGGKMQSTLFCLLFKAGN